MTTDQLITRIAADKPFYDNSGGGVTFSGGEPFAQPGFLEELLKGSKRLGIHTVIETCGHCDPRAIARCEPFVDLFLYDIKAIDLGLHEKLTGNSNSLILENLRTLASNVPGKLAVRVPVVPACTDDAADLEAIADFLCSLGIAKVELMPYHSLGADKYASFGRDYGLGRVDRLAGSAVEKAAWVLSQRGMVWAIGGE